MTTEEELIAIANEVAAQPRLPETMAIESIAEPEFPPAMVVRPLPMEEGLRRMQERRRMAIMQQNPGSTEGEAEKHARETREADVVAAARRSQAEIRRHIDAYLKEHLETVVADVLNLISAQIGERVATGIAAMEEHNAVVQSRIEADTRARFRAFVREYVTPKPTKRAQRATRSARGKAR